MKLNREQQSILYAAENGTLENIAKEKARRNEAGWQEGWTVEQHLAYLEKKAAELKAELEAEAVAEAKKKGFSGRAVFANYRDADKALEQFGFGE